MCTWRPTCPPSATSRSRCRGMIERAEPKPVSRQPKAISQGGNQVTNTLHLMAAASTLIAIVAGAAAAVAQTPAPESPYAVTYIEVAPKSAEAARKLLRAYREAARKTSGVVEFEAFERIGHPNHFAIIEQWSNAKAREANAGSAHGTEFRKSVTPLLIAGYDERPHYLLTVGAKAAGAVHAITHVDLVPPRREEGAAATKALAEKSRGAAG